jgi:hypothetical protein
MGAKMAELPKESSTAGSAFVVLQDEQNQGGGS